MANKKWQSSNHNDYSFPTFLKTGVPKDRQLEESRHREATRRVRKGRRNPYSF